MARSGETASAKLPEAPGEGVYPGGAGVPSSWWGSPAGGVGIPT